MPPVLPSAISEAYPAKIVVTRVQDVATTVRVADGMEVVSPWAVIVPLETVMAFVTTPLLVLLPFCMLVTLGYRCLYFE